MKPAREQIERWLNDHVTEYVMETYFVQARQDIMEQWANGDFTGESSEATAQLNAKALGQVDQIDQTILSISDLIQEETQDAEPGAENPSY
jgi:hypothetical protein